MLPLGFPRECLGMKNAISISITFNIGILIRSENFTSEPERKTENRLK